MKLSELHKKVALLELSLEDLQNSITGQILKTRKICIIEKDIKKLKDKIEKKQQELSSLRFECPICAIRWNPSLEDKERAERNYDFIVMDTGNIPSKIHNPWFPACQNIKCQEELKLKNSLKR